MVEMVLHAALLMDTLSIGSLAASVFFCFAHALRYNVDFDQGLFFGLGIIGCYQIFRIALQNLDVKKSEYFKVKGQQG